MNTVNENLLNAVAVGSVSVTGAWVPTYGARNFGFQASFAGTPSAGTITFQGSNNGVNGFSLGTFIIGIDSNNDIKFAVDKPVAFVRATVGAVTGGASPTVSAWVSTSE